jgi:hypothetical protein
MEVLKQIPWTGKTWGGIKLDLWPQVEQDCRDKEKRKPFRETKPRILMKE